jgi:NAD(P)-dependent dehydrogenase (short-subunit alcohol dehydrogenase family)
MSKTWLITGASSGLGRLMTERLLGRGDRVVGTARREGALADLQTEHGDRLAVAMLDLTDTPGIRAVVDNAFRQLGRIDVVVSNAGYGLFGAAEEVTDPQIDHQIATNLTGSIQLIRAALPHLRQQGGGRSVAQEVAPFGIDFIIVEPGPTGTNFGASLVRVAPMDVYDDTPAGAVRRAVAEGSFAINGDAARTADAMISAADRARPALRLALGSSAYNSISRTLAQRLAAIEAQREVALSADRDGDETKLKRSITGRSIR